jgi:DNA invertase Pin-like site-specific DNA recombinase
MKTIKESRRRKAIIYIRVSTDEQAEKGFSLHDQEARLKAHCNHNNYEVVALYKEDYSAKDFNRPEFKQMLLDIRVKKFRAEVLLCARFDRFSRNLQNSLNMIDELDRLGIVLETLETNYDLSVPENKLPYMLQMILPQIENERRSLNTQRGMRQAQREGKWMSLPPKGYSSDYATGERQIVPNSAAKFVLKAFEQIATGLYTIEEIRKQLWQEGFKMSKSNFHRLLHNPVYCGKILIKAWKNEPIEIVQGDHTGIVSEEIFLKTQDILLGRKRATKAKAVKDENLPLRGFLKCNCCGGNLTGSRSTSRDKVSKTYYYHCQNGCKERFRAIDANAEFVEYLNAFEIKDEVMKLYTLILQDIFNKDENNRMQEISLIEKQISIQENRKNALLEKFSDDHLSQSDYENGKKRCEENIGNLIFQKIKLERDYTDFMKTVQFGFGLLKNLPDYYRNCEISVKLRIIGSLFPEKLIYENKNYRTNKINEVIPLICSNINAYGEILCKKGEGFIKPSPFLQSISP